MHLEPRLSGLPTGQFLFYSLDRELALDFFMLFARFEFALKNSRFATTRGRSNAAMADWTAFAKEAQRRWALGPLPDGVHALVAHPPLRQVLNGTRLGWGPVEPVETVLHLDYVLKLVRTVRNNLFHGGKFPYPGDVPDPARDRTLLEASLDVLLACVALLPEVEDCFGYDGDQSPNPSLQRTPPG